MIEDHVMCVEFMESGWNILVTYHPDVPAMLKLGHHHLGLWETFFKNQYDACHSLLYSYYFPDVPQIKKV